MHVLSFHIPFSNPSFTNVVFENIYVEYPLDLFPVLKLKLEFCSSPFYTTTFPFLIFQKDITVEAGTN